MLRICTRAAWAAVALCSTIAVAAPHTESDFDSSKLPPPAKRSVDFAKDIQPLLVGKCIACHGATKHESGLGLHTREAAMAGGDGGKAIEPGKSAESRIVQLASGVDPDESMPPDGEGTKLNAEQVGLLRAWIDQGAKWPDGLDLAAGAKSNHWSYQPVKRPELPAVKNKAWPRNPIDAFVLARLEKEGLSPSPEASRERLIRRVSLDLIGLPPTPAEVNAFLNDKSPNAYEKVVDRLLAAPQYGERWARPWLDAARYADSDGYDNDPVRVIWPYRDWVIKALNQDMPYDQFTIEQIAGDLLPKPTLQQRIATGFHRNTMTNSEGGVNPEEYRIYAVIDRVNTTATVWLGATLACAQCHTHKYDPFRQKEYYQLMAFFNNTSDPGNVPGKPLLMPTPAQANAIKELEKIEAVSTSSPELKAVRDKLVETRKVLEAKIAKTLVMNELPQPRETHVFMKGNFQTLGEKVTPNTPAVLPPMTDNMPRNRLGLAKWLVDPANPLPARVTVNRYWQEFFGIGLVRTSEDFGTKGEKPTHPELLDWMASEFVKTGWRVKAMHRLIVTSATYRQDSRVNAAIVERDPENRLMSRGPRFRLEAELVRDQALQISGLLNKAIGGPSVNPPQPPPPTRAFSGDVWVMSKGDAIYRRGLYTHWQRTNHYPSFMSFDAPSRQFCVVRRPRSNTPLQALTIMNDPVYMECAQGLAKRMMTEAGGKPGERIARGFKLCTSRVPQKAEIQRLMSLYQAELVRFRRDNKSANEMVGTIFKKMPKGTTAAEFAAWTVVANVLLNLDETITKG